MASADHLKVATFGAGRFWAVEARFRRIPGVVDTRVGYMGGQVSRPTHEQVQRGDTGHVEVVRVLYDASRVSYEQLLDAFWLMHDPTRPDGQGDDSGSQYRSVIFTHDEAQQRAAEQSLREQQASGRWPDPILTEIRPAGRFWRAAETHQRFLEKVGAQCPRP